MQLPTFYTPTIEQINEFILPCDPKLTPAFVREIKRRWGKFVKSHPELEKGEAEYLNRYSDLESADRMRAFLDEYDSYDDPYHPAIEHIEQANAIYGLRQSSARRVTLLLFRGHHGVLYNVARSIEIAWAHREIPGVNVAIQYRFMEFANVNDDTWLQPSMIEDEIAGVYMSWITDGVPDPVDSLVFG